MHALKHLIILFCRGKTLRLQHLRQDVLPPRQAWGPHEAPPGQRSGEPAPPLPHLFSLLHQRHRSPAQAHQGPHQRAAVQVPDMRLRFQRLVPAQSPPEDPHGTAALPVQRLRQSFQDELRHQSSREESLQASATQKGQGGQTGCVLVPPRCAH